MKNWVTVLFICPFILFSQVKEIPLNQNWKFRKSGDKEWMPATVPGTVHTDLLANKKIQDPFLPESEKKLQWIENCDWEYETEILCADYLVGKQNMELQFKGLDTYANVYLNDSLILVADNMFRTWTVDIKKCLKFPVSKLRIVFESAVNKEKELAKKLPYTLPEGTRVFTRKAQYQYGWDFAPRFVTCGIWKDIKLVVWDDAKLENIEVVQHPITDSLASLTFNCEVNCKKTGEYHIVISSLEKKNKGINSMFNTPINPGTSTYELNYDVKNPKLWWCNGKGNPNMYHFKIQLLKEKEVIDVKHVNVGIRRVGWDTEKDSTGYNFYFKLNGVPVFMKGANYIPQDIFLPRVKKEDYEKIIQNAIDANMNMLRVWGGGVYADDEFYKLCDMNGILVWQDFMFACAMYPGDKKFMENVGEEIKEQVKRLRNHPCIAIWCGNNEIDEGWKNWGWQKQNKYSKNDSTKIADDYTLLFDNLILDTLRAHVHTSALCYIPSSPQIGWGHTESLQQGDSHYWGVWWGMEPFENYNKKVGRFMSEYGFQGIPNSALWKKYSADSLSFKTLKGYEKHPKGFETIQTYMERDFKVPKNAEDYIYVSQLVQARGMEIAIEAHRRNKPYCMGSLYWQLNDCWPGISWSSLDYDGNWKATHYSVKKSFSPIIISLQEKGDTLTAFLLSDMRRYLGGRLTLKLYDLSGKELWEDEINIREFKDCFEQQVILPISEKKYKRGDLVLKADWQSFTSSLPPVRALHYFVAPKYLELQKPEIKIEWLGKHLIGLTTNTLAKNVFLDGGEGVFFWDNYFDLLPGEKLFVNVKYPKGKKPVIKIMSLIDAQ